MQFKAVLASAAIFASASHAEVQFRAVDMHKHVYDGGWEHFVGGGIAAFDCNGDDFPELYAAGGSNRAQLFLNKTTGVGRGLAFRPTMPGALAFTGVTGAYPLDINGDGNLDLAILRVGEDKLMQGHGNCVFSEFEGLSFDGGDLWTTAFSATWEGDATLPTLAFGAYVDRKDPSGPFGTCDATQLYRPDGQTYSEPIALTPGYCTLSILFSDWARNGRSDLRISNDRHYYGKVGTEQLWAMDDRPRLYSEQDGWSDFQIWGMGIASRDVTGDGFADVFLSSMGDQKLQYFDPSTGGPSFADAGYASGTTAHRPFTGPDTKPSTGWHVAFGDVQNDGLDDLFIAKGNVQDMDMAAMSDPNNLLIQAEDGSFVEVADKAGVASMARSRGAALMDLNLDGKLDLAVVQRQAPLAVYQNTSSTFGAWAQILVQQDRPNTQAVGAFVEVQTETSFYTQEITVGGGHASGQAGALHFGLGDVDRAEVRVIWPDGTKGTWMSLGLNRRTVLER